jgi:Ca2+-binding EF-hand superfamily protein
MHSELLSNLFAFVKDDSSALYNGFVTCNVDPSFSHGLQATMLENDDDFEIFSAIPEVMNILEKYRDVRVPSYVPNLSHFRIYLCFEGITKSIMVPNPLILSKNKCFIWPFEVKRGIGMMDNMQELWIEPTALVPIGLPKSLSEPIYFSPSARCDGNVVIHATKLKADLCYNVICEDNRMAVMNMLSEEEKETIKATFDSYDRDGNGTISKLELDELVRKRTSERKDLIDQQFASILEENDSDENFLRAEETRRMQYQQLGEAQNKLVRMFENCDVNGDGQVNFSEFLLAEAWWLRCTINPEHASLF